MKKGSKFLLLVFSAAMLIIATMFGTLAYLTSSAEVVNTFTVGNVEITLDEAKVDPDGTPVPGADRVIENKYHLVPGHTYTKDPTMTVKKGSEESFVRIIVTINKTAELKAIFGADFLPENYVTGWDRNIWQCVEITDNGDNTASYEFRYHTAVKADTDDLVLEALFTSITVPGTVTGEQLATINDLKITAEGHAIQTSGFDSVDAAWKAFGDQYVSAVTIAAETTAAETTTVPAETTAAETTTEPAETTAADTTADTTVNP